jgi:hypothetical protein
MVALKNSSKITREMTKKIKEREREKIRTMGII